jgi:ubiquinone/menaquinone biosynthesis C-methylase UbiE
MRQPDRERGEERRLAEVYGRYATTERRRRAWDARNEGNVAIRAEVSAAVRSAAGEPWPRAAAVADLGCGAGWWLRDLASQGFPQRRLYGLDALPDRVEAARASLPQAELLQGDVRDLPWAAGSFWMALLFTVLSSMPSRAAQAQALSEAVRVLEPGGHLFVWEPRVVNPGNSETLLVRRATLRRMLGPRLDVQPVTVVPALARRLGGLAPAYPLLARTRVLCTHRLVHFRKP